MYYNLLGLMEQMIIQPALDDYACVYTNEHAAQHIYWNIFTKYNVEPFEKCEKMERYS